MKFLIPAVLFIAVAILLFLKTSQREETEPSDEITQNAQQAQKHRLEHSQTENRTKPTLPSNLNQIITNSWMKNDFKAVTDHFREWIEHSPEDALEFVAEIKLPLEAAHFAPEIKLYMDTLAPAEAMTQTLKLKQDHNLQESVSADAFARWLEDDGKSSVSWLFENHEQAFTHALAERSGRAGHFGPAPEALKIAFSQETNALQSRLVKGILLGWLFRDETAAINHLNTTASSPIYDEAIISYATQTLGEQPVEAMLWLDNIQNEDLRKMISSKIKLTWTEEQEAQYRKAVTED